MDKTRPISKAKAESHAAGSKMNLQFPKFWFLLEA